MSKNKTKIGISVHIWMYITRPSVCLYLSIKLLSSPTVLILFLPFFDGIWSVKHTNINMFYGCYLYHRYPWSKGWECSPFMERTFSFKGFPSKPCLITGYMFYEHWCIQLGLYFHRDLFLWVSLRFATKTWPT